MATAQSVIDSARYDLEDFGQQKWTDTQLLNLLNRMVGVLDSALISLDSDFTKTSGSVTLLSGNNTVAVPTTTTDTIFQVWYGTVLLLKEPLEVVMHRYQINNSSSSTARPSFWAHNNNNIYFNIEADTNYALTVYYHQRSAALLVGSSMPYSDRFNEILRESIVSAAHKAKDDNISRVDNAYYNLFKQNAVRYVISRNTIRKKWNLGF